MPRKTKEQTELENENNIRKSTTKQTTTAKKTSSSLKENTTKKEVSTKKKTATKKSTTKATTNVQSKTSITQKKASTPPTRKTSTQKANSSNKKVDIVEYYDLPYRYNQTLVKVLAQTPTKLFIYWDISDKDRKNFQKLYGDDFFETTRPILIVYNDTLHYSFEVEINDFANSWYLPIEDSKCDYRIELGRRPIIKTEKLNTDYIYITTSNEIESPNNRILFDNNQKMVYFRNVKTGQHTGKTLSSVSLIRNMGKIYNIYDIYQTIYPNENIEDICNNPSSDTSRDRRDRS